MEYYRIIDIITLIGPFVIMWVITFVAYLRMKDRFTRLLHKYERLTCAIKKGKCKGADFGHGYRNYRACNEKLLKLMDAFRLKDFD